MSDDEKRERNGSEIDEDPPEQMNDETNEETLNAEDLLTKLKDDKLLDNIELDVMEKLKELTEDSQITVLKNYENAARDSNQSIRNPSAFLAGIVRRQRDEELKGKSFDELPEAVKNELSTIFEEGQITRDDFEQRCMTNMFKLSESTMIETITKLKSTDKSSIKNYEGFFNGILRRFAGLEEGRRKGLDDQIKQMIDDAIADGKIKEDDLEPRCYDALAELPKGEGMDVVRSFLDSDLSNVRNMGGFFFGIINRFKRNRGGGRRQFDDRRGPPRRDRYDDRRDRRYDDRRYDDRRYDDRRYDDRRYDDRRGGYGRYDDRRY